MKIMRIAQIAFCVAALTVTASSQQIQINKENKTIAITTSDQAEAIADTAVISIGFHIFGKDQDGTYADATRTSNAIITALTAAGVPKDAIESSRHSLSARLIPVAMRTRHAMGKDSALNSSRLGM